MNSRILHSRSRLLIAAFLLLLCGFTIGRVVSVISPAGSLVITPDTQGTVPTVSIEGIVDGKLRGEVIGDVRLSIDGQSISVAKDGSFIASPEAFAVQKVTVQVPEGMQYVASRKGKKYYSVTSPMGQKLVPKNRVYFQSREEAEAAGYRP